jgi:hypothetical protein
MPGSEELMKATMDLIDRSIGLAMVELAGRLEQAGDTGTLTVADVIAQLRDYGGALRQTGLQGEPDSE